MTALTASGSYQAYFETAHKQQGYSEQPWTMFSDSISGTDPSFFDLASIHPSHGLSPVTGSFVPDGQDEETSSAAQKIMAAMAACGEPDGAEGYTGTASGQYHEEPQDWTSESSFDAASTGNVSIGQSQLNRNESISSSFYFSSSLSSSTASMSLERVSSCYFDPPSAEQHIKDSLVPLDRALERRLSTPTTPCIPASAPQNAALPSSMALSFSLAPTQSTSSFMMRSYSAPAQTQAQFDTLKQRWNAEALAAAELTEAGPSSQVQTSPRPKIARRNTSAHIPSLRRQRESEEEHSSDSYGSHAHGTFTSHSHMLSPAHKHNPFKRSRLSFTAIREADDTFSEDADSPRSSITEQRAPSPPKSPVRPSLNRFFTSPEFYLGDPQDTATDEEEAFSQPVLRFH